MAGGKQVRCVIVSPERALLDESADYVVLPMFDGELGVLPGRAPLIGRLGFGEMRIRQGEKTSRFYIDGGFAQVRGDTVSVLTPRAMPASEIKADKASENLEAARGKQIKAATVEAQNANLKAIDRARAQLRVARHEQEANA
jgi:F-type H+-transporting ATPase subunit epsilon